MTKTPFNQGTGETRMCSAHVEYKGRRGSCKREAKYPDADGMRWWCGLHDPASKKRRAEKKAAKKAKAEAQPVEEKVVTQTRPVTIPPQVAKDILVIDEMLTAMEEAREAFISIANTKDTGWPPSTPVASYQTILAELNGQAKSAADKLTEALKFARSSIS